LLREEPLYECVQRAAHLFASGVNLRRAIEEGCSRTGGDELSRTGQGGGQGLAIPIGDRTCVRPFGLAVTYARLGRKDLALSALEQAFDRRDIQLTEINVEPACDGLR
jgi:hypothetical protein